MIAFRSATSGYASAATIVVAKPAETAEGDVLVAGYGTRGGSDVTHTLPADWIQITDENNSTSFKLTTAYKVAGGAEPANYTFTVSAINREVCGIQCYTGVDNAAPVDASGDASGTDANPTAPSIDTNVANTMLVAFMGHNESHAGTTPPTSMTERYDVTGTGATGSGADVLQAAIGATGTKAFAALNTTIWCAALIALKPEAAPMIRIPRYGFTNFQVPGIV